MRQTLRLHGRTHAPGGSDPIPGLGGSAPRIVFGCVFNDGGTDDVGSGDWECEWSGSGSGATGYPALNIYTFTVSPAFSAAIKVVVATPSNNNAAGDGGSPAEYFVGVDSTIADVGSFTVMTWDQIGDPDSGGFAFAAFEDPA